MHTLRNRIKTTGENQETANKRTECMGCLPEGEGEAEVAEGDVNAAAQAGSSSWASRARRRRRSWPRQSCQRRGRRSSWRRRRRGLPRATRRRGPRTARRLARSERQRLARRAAHHARATLRRGTGFSRPAQIGRDREALGCKETLGIFTQRSSGARRTRLLHRHREYLSYDSCRTQRSRSSECRSRCRSHECADPIPDLHDERTQE